MGRGKEVDEAFIGRIGLCHVRYIFLHVVAPTAWETLCPWEKDCGDASKYGPVAWSHNAMLHPKQTGRFSHPVHPALVRLLRTFFRSAWVRDLRVITYLRDKLMATGISQRKDDDDDGMLTSVSTL